MCENTMFFSNSRLKRFNEICHILSQNKIFENSEMVYPTLPDPAFYKPPLAYASEWPAKLEAPWWYFNPEVSIPAFKTAIHWYHDKATPSVAPLVLIFLGGFILLTYILFRNFRVLKHIFFGA